MQKHVRATAPDPRFLTGVYVVLDQVLDDIRNDLPPILLRVETAVAAGDITALKLSLEALSRHVGNIQGNVDAATRLCVSHINRKPRI
jgi:hypothetical protein